MPRLRPVTSLSSLAMLQLARAVASAIASLVGHPPPVLEGSSKKSNKRHKKKSQSVPVRPTLLVPEKELKRMKNYLEHARPKQSKENLFHEVLTSFTRFMTFSVAPEKRKKFTEQFLNRVMCFETGLSYILDLFLDFDIKCIDFTIVQHLAMNWVDSTRLANRDPKAESAMNHGQVARAMLKVVGQRATKLRRVERFVWPHLVSGELLRVLGGHCAALQELVLACDCQVAGRDEDENTFTLMASNGSWEDDVSRALASLYGRAPGNFSGSDVNGCPQLKKLVLPQLEDENGIAAASLASALCILTQLEFVSGVPMMSALMKFRSKNSSLKSLKLQNIGDHDPFMRRPAPNVSYLKDLLPKLDSIDIIASPATTRSLSETFSHVTVLKVEWPDFENRTKLFPNLETLDLILDYRGVWQLLRNLGKHCKSLKSLTLRQPTLFVSDDHEEGVAPPKIASLEHFHLFRSSFIEFTAFKHLMMGCPGLKKLHITLTNDRNYIVDEFGDALVRSVVPYFENLESFKVESLYRYNLCMHLNCTLSIDTVRYLIKNCPNISYIGHLDSWDVEDAQIEEVLQEIRRQNFDLYVQ